MYLIFVVCVWIIFGIIFIDWKSWKEYYPTILYYCVVNALYDFLYYNHSLWEFRAITTDYLNHTIISIVFYFIVIPISIFIFLQRFPTRTLNKVIYILAWAFFYWIIEFFYVTKGMFIYKNGWNIWHSLWFDVLMFLMIRLHYKKTRLALIITFFTIIIFVIMFPIPFASLK